MCVVIIILKILISDVLTFCSSIVASVSLRVLCLVHSALYLDCESRDFRFDLWLSHQMKSPDRCNNKDGGFTIGD